MNYGKNNLSKRKSSISSKKKMKKKRVGVRFFKAVITCMLLLQKKSLTTPRTYLPKTFSRKDLQQRLSIKTAQSSTL